MKGVSVARVRNIALIPFFLPYGAALKRLFQLMLFSIILEEIEVSQSSFIFSYFNCIKL